MYVDPSGCYLLISGTEEEKEYILSELNQLIDSFYSLTPIEIEGENGEIYWKILFHSPKLKYFEEKKPNGNQLLRDLITNDHTTTIYYYRPEEGQDPGSYTKVILHGSEEYELGMERDVAVYFDPNYKAIAWIEKDGKIYLEESEPFIVLAHELIHAARYMLGLADPLAFKINASLVWDWSYNIYGKKLKKIYDNKTVSVEELRTVGIFYDNRLYITENLIRSENNAGYRWYY